MLRSTHIDCSLSPVISCVFNKTLPGSTEPDAAEQIHLDSAALTRGTYQGFSSSRSKHGFIQRCTLKAAK